MKVVYRTIVDDIVAAKARANIEKRTIKRIELSREEWLELRNQYKLSYDQEPRCRGDFLGVTEDVYLYADHSWGPPK